jgi:hypothetical protein
MTEGDDKKVVILDDDSTQGKKIDGVLAKCGDPKSGATQSLNQEMN